MPRFPKRYADTVARLRVPSGFLIVFVFGWFSRPTVESLWLGLPVAVGGLLVRAWAAGCLAKNQQLAISGPYAYTRNPLYLGTLLVAAGLVIAARSVWLGVLFASVFLFVYLPVIELEEQHLRRLFPAYERYAAEVPILWPRFGGSHGNAFRLALYWKNQEYQAALGLLAGALYLVWKVLPA
jgi:protein-S-isoprenylcysteine O-methyltransferase Ste14